MAGTDAGRVGAPMGDVLVQCAFARESDRARVLDRIVRALAPARLRGELAWRGAALSQDGMRSLLWLSASRASRVRAALASLPEVRAVWAGTLSGSPFGAPANVLVERQSAGEHHPLLEVCLRTHRVDLVRSLVSHDGLRSVRMYAAPDAESVRLAERSGGVGAGTVWAFEWLPVDAWLGRR